MRYLGKSFATFLRAVLACVSLFFLTGCHKNPCEKCLTAKPVFPKDSLVVMPKKSPAYQERNYDLCLLKHLDQKNKTKVSVIRKGQTWTFVLPSDLLFDNDTAEIKQSYEPVLGVIADFMRTYPKITVTVRAYLDKPQEELKTKFGTIQDELTQRQADAMVEDLTARHINARLIIGEGMGNKDPVAWDGTPIGRYLNRRVEISFRYYRDSTAWY